MSSTTDTTPAEQLLTLVTDSTILSDQEKELYVSELLEGRLHPDLEAKLDVICDTEIAVSTKDIADLTEEIAVQDATIEAASREDDTEGQVLVSGHQEELEEIVTSHKEGGRKIERQFDADVEGDVRKEESSETEAIRTMLKEDPSA